MLFYISEKFYGKSTYATISISKILLKCCVMWKVVFEDVYYRHINTLAQHFHTDCKLKVEAPRLVSRLNASTRCDIDSH